MPLTDIQKEVLDILATNRSEASHFAGGVVINVHEESPRYSKDFDMFHEAIEDLARASEQDLVCLQDKGFNVEKMERDGEWQKPSSFRRAKVTKGKEQLDLDWAHDSAFRFFPIVEDAQLGWRLHDFDIATNKAHALAARTETKDYIDILTLCKKYPLEAILWAAVGKDPGFNPMSLFQMVMRFARVNPLDLPKLQAKELDPIQLKEEWIRFSDQAREEIPKLADTQPDIPIGVAFVNEKGEPGWIGKDPSLQIHKPSLRGCWPEVDGA